MADAGVPVRGDVVPAAGHLLHRHRVLPPLGLRDQGRRGRHHRAPRDAPRRPRPRRPHQRQRLPERLRPVPGRGHRPAGRAGQARRREGDGLPAAPRRPPGREPDVRAPHGQADRRRGGAASCSSASSSPSATSASADETFGAWIDRQEPGRLELLVGGPVEPLLAPEHAAVPPPRAAAHAGRPGLARGAPRRPDGPRRRGLARPRPVPRQPHHRRRPRSTRSRSTPHTTGATCWPPSAPRRTT